MGAVVSNNAWGTLAVPITAQGTQILVSSGQGDRFPNAVEGVSWFFVTLADQENNIEIVKCTKKMGDTFTIARAMDNTMARAFKAGDRVEVRPCAALFDDKVSQDALQAKLDELKQTIEKSISTSSTRIEEKLTALEEKSLPRSEYESKTDSQNLGISGKYLSKEDAEKTYLKLAGGTITGKLVVNGVGGQESFAVRNGNSNFGSGDVWAKTFHSSSDRMLKEDIVPFEAGEGAKLVDNLTPVWFTWAQDQTADFGVIAQEVEKVLPEAVFEREGRKYVNYSSLVAVAFAAIKDLRDEVKELKRCQKS